ncbi:MAG: hypothetical protein AVDCRST_MAG42-3061 [uncultured Chthoniobacterales bacterium]|uniref:Uncharacterized protein n=1 Tax=uncultured Chthoniobacterales bacterium TaxID=1836801 RepID=A0A6J4J0U8_9BACT|nr:MAG: hypothetical protein AVDCRST_MAG42-3061 [uncultured Chthoniobacterales bacterium]
MLQRCPESIVKRARYDFFALDFFPPDFLPDDFFEPDFFARDFFEVDLFPGSFSRVSNDAPPQFLHFGIFLPFVT